MRLFIAIEPDEALRDSVCRLRDKLRSAAVSGRITPDANIHLTLAFLSELPPSRAAAIRRCMEAAAGDAFDLSFSRLGRFKRGGGDIWWLGTESCPALMTLAGTLARNLREAGFALEDRPFAAHLTLGRDMIMPPDFRSETLGEIRLTQHVGHITLFSSELGRGAPIYRPVFKVPLK